MTDIYRGSVKPTTISWLPDADICPNCEPDEYQQRTHDGGTYITVRVPSGIPLSLGDEYTLTITGDLNVHETRAPRVVVEDFHGGKPS